MFSNPFRGYSHRHLANVEGSQRTYARAGIFDTPDGTEEPAVVIFRDRACLAILTPEDAIRVSNEIIDAIESPAC